MAPYLGIWYEIARFQNSHFENNTFCDRANYTLSTTKSGYLNIINSGRTGSVTGKYIEYLGEAHAKDPKVPSELLVKFGTSPFPAPYKIVDTDYKTYAVVYSCISVLGVYHLEWSWIMGRTPTLNQDLVSSLMGKLKSYGVHTDNFRMSQQTGCTYGPSYRFK